MAIKFDDSELYKIQYSPVCAICANLDIPAAIKGKRKCKAFAEIPDEIWDGKNDHKKPYPGDHGIRFELKKKE